MSQIEAKLAELGLTLPAALPADVREPARETLAGAMVEADLLGGSLGMAAASLAGDSSSPLLA